MGLDHAPVKGGTRSACGGETGFDIPHGRLAEEAAVLAIELASAFVANFEGGAGGVQTVMEHAFPGYM
jgi:hypothetical protein